MMCTYTNLQQQNGNSQGHAVNVRMITAFRLILRKMKHDKQRQREGEKQN